MGRNHADARALCEKHVDCFPVQPSLPPSTLFSFSSLERPNFPLLFGMFYKSNFAEAEVLKEDICELIFNASAAGNSLLFEIYFNYFFLMLFEPCSMLNFINSLRT